MRRVPAGARGLPRDAYTSEQTFLSELECIFSREWVAVARSEDLAGPGDFVTTDLAGESILLVRGEDGPVRGFYNVCRHRGSRLCDVERGHVGAAIRCPYHAWTYALDGRLLGARHMGGVEGFSPDDFPLWRAAVSEWEGFVLVNLAEPAPPLDEAFYTLEGRFAAWELPRLRRAARREYDVAANWKLIISNYSECYHCPLIHPALARLSPPESGENDLREGRVLGGWMDLNESVTSMSIDGTTSANPLPRLTGRELRRVHYYSVFPTLLLSLHPDYVMAHFLRPQGVDRTRVVCEWYFHPAAMERPEFDSTGAVEFWDVTNRQDWLACERSQSGIASRAYQPGPYAHVEELLWAFDEQYRLAMIGSQS